MSEILKTIIAPMTAGFMFMFMVLLCVNAEGIERDAPKNLFNIDQGTVVCLTKSSAVNYGGLVKGQLVLGCVATEHPTMGIVERLGSEYIVFKFVNTELDVQPREWYLHYCEIVPPLAL